VNPKQELFAFEYAHSLNATDAAIRAGYSEASAYSQGHDLLKKPEIQARITELLDERRAEQQRRFVNAADRAIQTLEEVMADTSATPSARVSAATAILDRGGHSVVTKSLVKAEVNVHELNPEQRAERFAFLLDTARARRIGSDTGSDPGAGDSRIPDHPA
jgi:phage terminase small subunit